MRSLHMAKMINELAVTLAAVTLIAAGANAQDLPGSGKSVRIAKPTWDTGWFQTEIYRRALQELGFEVAPPVMLHNDQFYDAVGQGEVDLWVSGWFPLHESYTDAFLEGAEPIGYVTKYGALQGYLVDKKTADENGITGLSDFSKKDIRSLFDSDGDGKAELVGCPPEWACRDKIALHLDEWGLGDHIEPTETGYSATMDAAIEKYRNGQPILFYSWTPSWVVGVLTPGEDAVWIQTPEASKQATIADIDGCVDNPCQIGWDANDIRAVANTAFLNANPAVRTLLERMTVPLGDILAQNARLHAGEDTPEHIERHAAQWVEENREIFAMWIRTAIDAASDQAD